MNRDRIRFIRQLHDGPVLGNPIFDSRLALAWRVNEIVTHSEVADVLSKFIPDLPDFQVGTMRYPGVPVHPYVGIRVTTAQVEKLTELALKEVEEKSRALSVYLDHNFHVPRIRFDVTPELWQLNVVRLPEMLHKQTGFAHSLLLKALQSSGPCVTDEQIQGIVELATEHLWPCALEDAISRKRQS